jgi:hypothetical protein
MPDVSEFAVEPDPDPFPSADPGHSFHPARVGKLPKVLGRPHRRPVAEVMR